MPSCVPPCATWEGHRVLISGAGSLRGRAQASLNDLSLQGLMTDHCLAHGSLQATQKTA